jgi:hypothetical protein
VAVPEPMVVFTVKLPVGVAERLRQHAQASGRTLSGLVDQAVSELLDPAAAGA